MNNEFAEFCFDESIEFETMLLLAAIGSNGRWADGFDEFVEDADEKDVDRLFGDGAWHRACAYSGSHEPSKYPNSDGMNELIMNRQKYGLLVQVSRVEFERITATTGRSTGLRNLRWFYADDLPSLVDQVKAWAREREAAEFAKAGFPVPQP